MTDFRIFPKFRHVLNHGTWVSVIAAMLTGGPANAAPPPVKVSGFSPFAVCTADDVASQPGRNYPDSEIEPWIEINPANSNNLIAGWQQDRWSDGGARGLVAGVSIDGGVSWARLVPPGISKCSGGIYDRATDPWVAISPNGTAYFMALAFNNNRPDGASGQNAMLVSRSRNGGMSWSNPVPLIVDTDGQIFNDKNSLTADPLDSRYVYAVWDRYFDFTVPSASRSLDLAGKIRERRRLLNSGAKAKPALKAPTVFTRTVNGGDSWEPPKVIYDPGEDAQTLGSVIAVLPDSSIVNVFFNFDAAGEAAIGVQKSFDKGKTFTKPTFPIDANVTPTGTLSPDDKAPVRDGNSLLDVAVDRQNGNLYVVWQDGRDRNMDKVMFAQSTDGGTTFSKPAFITMTPESAVKLRNQSTTPSIEVGAGHQIAVTYYDFRFDKSDGIEAMDYFAVFCTPSASVDCSKRRSWGDGAVAGQDIRLTRRSFNILDAPKAGGHFLGDYVGLTKRGSTFIPAFGIADGKNKVSVNTVPFRSKSP
jgi:hypothetical protein